MKTSEMMKTSTMMKSSKIMKIESLMRMSIMMKTSQKTSNLMEIESLMKTPNLMNSTKLMPFSPFSRAHRSLLPALQENGKHRDAADMAKYFNQDARELVRILCDGHLYREAVFEAGQQAAVAPSSVSDHLTEYAQQMLAKVRADHSQFNGYVRRLETVRKHKAERLLNGDDGDDDLADFDMFSDTTSMNSSRMSGGSSRHSGRSRRSSKNRRKHERRLTSLKEGNPFEDIALIDALYTLCHKIHDQQPPMRDLLQSLIAVGLDGVGVEVQAAFQQSLADIAKALDVVWIPELMVPGEPKFEEFSDYVKLQTELHYAMISEYRD